MKNKQRLCLLITAFCIFNIVLLIPEAKADPMTNAAVATLKSNVTTFNGYQVIIGQQQVFPVPYCWAIYFEMLAALKFNITLAKQCILASLSTQEANGMIPNAPISGADCNLRSQPPLLAPACWAYYQATNDSSSLALWYPKLQQYFSWENEYSDIRGNYLYAPLTGRTTSYDNLTPFYAACSTGMDNMPAFDAAATNVTKEGSYYYLPMNDLMLSSTMALFAKDMALIALTLGNSYDAASYSGWYDNISNAINAKLWNQTEGRYNDQLWTGQQIQVNTIETFMPMIAGIPNQTQASDLVSQLQNLAEYNSTGGIPTVAANDPKFYSSEPAYFHSVFPYWRGGIWAPTTYLVYQGLTNYGYTVIANSVATTWCRVIERNMQFPEYFNSDGTAGGSAQPYQSWTAAVTLLFDNGTYTNETTEPTTTETSVSNSTVPMQIPDFTIPATLTNSHSGPIKIPESTPQQAISGGEATQKPELTPQQPAVERDPFSNLTIEAALSIGILSVIMLALVFHKKAKGM